MYISDEQKTYKNINKREEFRRNKCYDKKNKYQEDSMWNILPTSDKEEYKKIILAFASLSEMFAQKKEEEESVDIAPIVNSKFQETVFQKAFHATAEDIKNTSFDASLIIKNENGETRKTVVGIKTFGIESGDQKVAQFKANIRDWMTYVQALEKGAIGLVTKKEIDEKNKNTYLKFAKEIANIRNKRIKGSLARLNGFNVKDSEQIESCYHVLMPSKKGTVPQIFVGETPYDCIDIENITIEGCTSKANPSNFKFTDGNHTYKYTSADSQLYMSFHNKDIVVDTWDVVYAQNAYEIFASIANDVYATKLTTKIEKSFSWMLLNEKNEVELFSGFNAFNGVGSKLSSRQREKVVENIGCKYQYIEEICKVQENLSLFFSWKPSNAKERIEKAKFRETCLDFVDSLKNLELSEEIRKIMFRPVSELYIPLPNAKEFHILNPDFFQKGAGTFKKTKKGKLTSKLASKKEKRKFNLIFEPSGDSISCFITQDNGKAIESYEKQTILGNWLLREVFQLKEYQPLTAKRLEELEINGIRIYKNADSGDIHLEFIWIDEKNPPYDFINKEKTLD